MGYEVRHMKEKEEKSDFIAVCIEIMICGGLMVFIGFVLWGIFSGGW